MPQMQLPVFAPGLNLINGQVGYEKREGRVYDFFKINCLGTLMRKRMNPFRVDL